MPDTKIRDFFATIELMWDAVPSYIKVFFYSTISSTFGLYVIGELSWMAVAIIVMTNLGLYSGQRGISALAQ